jgi:MFS family permease
MSFGDVLDNREFAALWSAGALSNIGSSVHSITVIWVACTLMNDPGLVALVALATLVPDLVCSIPTGAFVDRFDRKWILILADLARAVAVATLSVVILTGRDGVLIPILVGGGVIAVVGPAGAFGLNAGSFALSAGILFVGLPSGLRASDSSSSDETTRLSRVVSDARSGLSFIVRTPVVLSVVFLSVLAGFAMAPLGVIFPFFLDSVGLASSVSFALCYGSIFVGIVVGFLNLNELVYRAARETLSFALVKLRMV